MISDAPSDRETLKAYVWGLAMACPVDGCNPSGCPLHDVRKLSLADRLVWVNGLDRAAMNQLAERHRACMLAKEFLDTASC